MVQTTEQYAAFGRVISAPAGLPIARAPDDALVELSLVRSPSLRERVRPPSGKLVHEMEDYPGGPIMRLWQDEQVTLLDYDGWRFALAPADDQICYAAHEPNRNHGHKFALTVERVLLPLYVLADQTQSIGLHGSAIALDDKAYIFIGRSGAGKSTTAYELMRRGATLIADDMTIVDVESGTALGATPTLRLWKSAGEVPEAIEDQKVWEQTTKRWFYLDPELTCSDRVPIGAVIFLDPDGTPAHSPPRLESSSQREALIALLEQTFDFSNPSHDWMTRRFRNASRLVKEYPCFRFAYTKSDSGEPTHVEPLLAALHDL